MKIEYAQSDPLRVMMLSADFLFYSESCRITLYNRKVRGGGTGVADHTSS